jgi:very-short-patch-repair endonuclease
MYLRKGIGGYKVRRQHPIGIYIVDFFCYKLRLIVEVDGSIHNNSDTKSNDIIRQSDLEKLGYTVIRFNNADIYQHFDTVLNKILIIVNNINKNKTL